MNTALVGYTGFVGSNLSKQYYFSKQYNSKNILEAYGSQPDLLVYSGVSAEKYLANQNPKKDFDNIENALNNIRQINAKKLVLISTIDVYKKTVNVNEESPIASSGLQSYGANRYHLERSVREEFSDALIIRLPGLFGKNIKKNFIYDFIHVVPSMVTAEKFAELSIKAPILKKYYQLKDNGFYQCIPILQAEKHELKSIFIRLGFSATNFTDSRGMFQFYNLEHLWKHVEIALKEEILLLNMVSEPITIEELFFSLTGNKFNNCITVNPPNYNVRTIYFKLFNGKNGYIFNKSFIKDEITTFIREQSC